MSTHRISPEDPSREPAPGRSSAGNRLRRAAASSVLAAVSMTGVGAVSAQAQETPEAQYSYPAPEGGSQSAVSGPAAVAEERAGRLAGVRADLANAVAWGSVTPSQAGRFYAQISDRIARGL